MLADITLVGDDEIGEKNSAIEPAVTPAEVGTEPESINDAGPSTLQNKAQDDI